MLTVLPLSKLLAKAVCQPKSSYTAKHVVFDRVSWKEVIEAAINAKNFPAN
jgi:hypothetical protein